MGNTLARAVAGPTAQPASSPVSQPPPPPQPTQPPPAPDPLWLRHTKQFSLFLAGAGFLASSVFVTRRSVIRAKLPPPPFYTTNRAASKPGSVDQGERALLAVNALSLATLNTTAFAVMLFGGISWGFDLSSVAELRERTQAKMRRNAELNPATPEDEEAMMELMESLMGKIGMEMPKIDGEGDPGGKEE